MTKNNTKIQEEEIDEAVQESNNDCQNCEEFKAKSEEYLNNWKRSQADYENLKKQTEKRIKDVIEYGNAELILDFLPLYNYYKLGINHIPENLKKESWFEGLSHIDSMWNGFFEKFGIKKVETLGSQFDHNIHEAIDFKKDESKKDHEILEELSAGYELSGKIIQPAKVVVNKLD